jgi:oligopeptide/dipeptide ABC transporter ATP-binding protein
VRQSALRRVRIDALSDVSLSVSQGEIVSVIGESGSGKSTLGRVLVGLDQPNRGAVFFANRPVRALKKDDKRDFRRSVQMVFQNPYRSFNPMLRIGTSLKEAARFARRGKGEAERPASELLNLVGLQERYSRRFPREMSGGELQRAAIARALATGPRIIFLDEPTSALDASVRGQVINVLLKLRRDNKLALILVSHELDVVRVLADRAVVLFRGQVVEQGTAEIVLGSPSHPYTHALVVGEGLGTADDQLDNWMLGEIDETDAASTGCVYQARCPFVTDQCRSEPQILQEVAEGHFVRCRRALEIKAAQETGRLLNIMTGPRSEPGPQAGHGTAS